MASSPTPHKSFFYILFQVSAISASSNRSSDMFIPRDRYLEILSLRKQNGIIKVVTGMGVSESRFS